MLVKLQALVVVVVLVSEETKFEVVSTSIILSYLHHFGNVNKNYLDTINLQHTKPLLKSSLLSSPRGKL